MHKYLVLDRGIFVGRWAENAVLKVNKIKKDKANNPLFKEGFFLDPPLKWEVRYDNGYPNVMYDPKYKIFRCYYTLFTKDEASENTSLEERGKIDYVPTGNRITSLCYAESADGIHWHKPSLGLVDFEGSKENNILFRYAHGTGVMLDLDEIDRRKRYKLITKVESSGAMHYMAVAFSEDGIHFSDLIELKKFNPAGDSHNFPFKDSKSGMYKLITRTWANGIRISSISESSDFINWSEPKEILRGDDFYHQIYSMPVIEYAGIYLGFASMYHEGDRLDENFDTVDLELKFSTDLEHWDSVAKGDYFIERGIGSYPESSEFDAGCIFTAAPIELDGNLWFYYMGGNGKHTNFRETSFARGSIKKDEFAFYENKRSGVYSRLVTSHFSVYGDYITIKADIAEDGVLKVSLGSKNGGIYEGFEEENGVLEKLSNGYYRLSYKNKKISDLGTTPVSIKMRFINVKIYAIEGELENQDLKY